MKPHKHKDVIIQWANGAVIQCKETDGTWRFVPEPIWSQTCEYRASIAEVEGRPVFEGNVLYYGGDRMVVELGGTDNRILITDNKPTPDNRFWVYADATDGRLSWNPPKPRTITIELLREDAEKMANMVKGSFIYCEDIYKIANVCKEALKEKP